MPMLVKYKCHHFDFIFVLLVVQMRKILLLMLIFFSILLFFGCDTHSTNNMDVENDYLNTGNAQSESNEESSIINKIIENSFLFDIKNEQEIPALEQEILAPLDLLTLYLFHSQSNKYIVSLTKKTFSNVFCSYLSNDLLDILDRVDVHEAECGDVGRFIWSGINNYLKKYKYAINNGLIDYESNKIKWIEYSDAYEVSESNNEMFLVCKVGYMEVEFMDLDNDSLTKEIIIAELDVIDYFKGIMTDKSYFVVADYKINDISITPYELITIVYQFNSFYLEDIDGTKYINSFEKELNKEFATADYFINEYYYYDRNDVLELMKN